MLAGLVDQAAVRSSTLEALEPYWPVLNGFADFIISSLPDPGDQLCTDDFEGPSPHNANLAAKGIGSAPPPCLRSFRATLSVSYI